VNYRFSWSTGYRFMYLFQHFLSFLYQQIYMTKQLSNSFFHSAMVFGYTFSESSLIDRPICKCFRPSLYYRLCAYTHTVLYLFLSHLRYVAWISDITSPSSAYFLIITLVSMIMKSEDRHSDASLVLYRRWDILKVSLAVRNACRVLLLSKRIFFLCRLCVSRSNWNSKAKYSTIKF
jgi:hypothetical protein